jgi:hypothetical protein
VRPLSRPPPALPPPRVPRLERLRWVATHSPPLPPALCSYLHKKSTPATREYLCRRLPTLPEEDVEKYLSQVCQLCAEHPDPAVERVLVGLCAKSLRLAVKVGDGNETQRHVEAANRCLWCSKTAIPPLCRVP